MSTDSVDAWTETPAQGGQATLFCKVCEETIRVDTSGPEWRLELRNFVSIHARRHGSVKVGFVTPTVGPVHCSPAE